MNKFKIGDLAYYYRGGNELRVGYVQEITGSDIWCNFQTFNEPPSLNHIKKDGSKTFLNKNELKLFIPRNINRRIIE